MVIIALVAASLAAGGVFAVVLSPPPSPCSGAIGAIRSFTIIVDLTGYNDTQSHGFAVTYYSNAGLELVGGARQTLKFQATRTGQFQIYCTIKCSVHYLMQNGLLNVT